MYDLLGIVVERGVVVQYELLCFFLKVHLERIIVLQGSIEFGWMQIQISILINPIQTSRPRVAFPAGVQRYSLPIQSLGPIFEVFDTDQYISILATVSVQCSGSIKLQSICIIASQMKVDTQKKSSLAQRFKMSSIQYYLIPFILFWFVVMPERIPSLELIAFFYGVLPLIDLFASLDLQNPNKQEAKQLEQDNIYFEICLYATIIMNWMCFIKIMNVISTDAINSLTYLEIIGHLIMYGNIAAMGIIISHEIYHKQGAFKKTIGLVSMINTFYIHWTVQHVIGHHRNVATPKDPATAPKDITFYEFFPRTLKGTWLSCYHIQKQKGKPLVTNLAIVSIFSNIALCALVLYWCGSRGLIFFVLGGILSFVLLEIINYLEHYGLSRKLLPSGEYQRVNIRHSWNTPHRFTNYIMFKLQRHSDHHQNSYKPYQTLLTLDQSPQLPQGYTAMLTVALFPKTFFEIMNPLLEYYKQKHEGKAPDESLRAISVERCKKFAKGMVWKLCGIALFNYMTTGYQTIDSIMAIG